jgi:PspA associated protein B
MGFLDTLIGKRKLAGPAPDRLFAISTAYVKFETELGITTRGCAAIVFQPLATADFESIVSEMEEVVKATSADSGTTVETSDDRYGFRWLVLRGKDFDDLVVGVNAVSSALEAGGYGERVLCAVFAFEDRPPAGSRALYWIYNYKRGYFYPFVPAPGAAGSGSEDGVRDTERELVLKAQVGSELPVEPELERWFPLWGIPI